MPVAQCGADRGKKEEATRRERKNGSSQGIKKERERRESSPIVVPV